jgi:hypothetical protein
MTGGLGNQLFIYACYMRMSKQYPHTRIDLSDMVHYHVHQGYELHRLFNLPQTEFCIHRPLKKVIEFLFFKTIIERKQDLSTLRAFRRPYFYPLIYFKGFYQSERYFADIAQEVRAAFTFQPGQASPRTRQLAERMAHQTQAVSLHIRRGDYLDKGVWENTGSVCTPFYYEQAMNAMSQRVEAPCFYLFSDDMAWAKQHFKREDVFFVDWNSGADSWQDMYLMSCCHHHIICNSTFSWWGAWLNGRTDKIVMAPEQWFQHGETPYIYPDNWTKIPTK